MRQRTLLLSLCLLLLLPAQTPPPRGVIVEQVDKGSEAETAGVMAGGLITGWSQGQDAGEIESPFDWTDFEKERPPRGPVAIRIFSASRARVWTLRNGSPGIAVRPVLRPELAAGWQRCRELEKTNKLAEAAQSWRGLIGQVNSSDPPWLSSWLEYQLAQLLARARQFSESDAAFQKAIELAQPARGSWRLSYEWAATFSNRDDRAGARDRFERALEQARKLASPSLSEAICLSQLGNVAASLGEWDREEEYHHQALSIRQMLAPLSIDTSNSLNNLGNLALDRGETDQAENYHRQALVIRQELVPGSALVAASLNNLGNVVSGRGDLAGAEQYYLQALTIQQKFGDMGAAASLQNLGVMAMYRGDFAPAEDYFLRALVIQRKQNPEGGGTAAVLTNLGSLAAQRKDMVTAERYFKQALAIQQDIAPASRDAAVCMGDLGDVEWARGDRVSGEAHHRQALAIMEKIAPGGAEIATVLNSAGETAFKGGDLPKAEEYHQRALAIRQKLEPGSTDEAQSLNNLGVVLRSKGETGAAGTYFARAVDALESQEERLGGTETVRSSFRALYGSYYYDLEGALLVQHQPAQAYRVSERARARGLLHMLAERGLMFAADVPADLQRARKRNAADYDNVQAQLAELNATQDKDKISAVQARLHELSVKRDEIADRIAKASPRFASLQYPLPLDVAATRRILDPGDVLLSYAVAEDRTALFVVAPEGSGPGLSVFTLSVKEKDLQAKVQEFRRLIREHREPGNPELMAQSRQLYDLLLRPAESVLAASQRLLVIPDGPLQVLPFAALRRNRTEYLVDWKPLHTVVSATVYAELRKMRHPAENKAIEIAAFGDPRMPASGQVGIQRSANPDVRAAAERGFDFGRLPFSRQEVQGIAALFPRRSQVYLGAEATEEHAKALGKDVRYIHFATHGVLDERFPLNSALVLSVPGQVQPGKDNGLLQAWEIFEQVRLDADLVTLSACNTGLGKELKGEGLIGLTRAFQYAGARSILASLWSVDDFRTMQLMQHFYTELRQGKSKDEALRTAQLELAHSQSSSAPYYWAGFSLAGDWK
jgi:CHAT domain-containing protein/Tfp pilus assembly protein PilF